MYTTFWISKYVYSYIYRPHRPSECLHTKNTSAHQPVPHNGTKIDSPAYIIKKVYKNTSYHQGASRAPPAAPPSGGGGGPPPPAPGGGGGTSAGPPCPGGRRPLVITASTTAHRMIDRHGGGNPMHCSRNSSSWIRVHMPSGTSQNTVSNQRTISSSLNTTTPVNHIWISKNMYTHIYIYIYTWAPQAIQIFTYTKDTLACRPVPHHGTKNSAHQPNQKSYT